MKEQEAVTSVMTDGKNQQASGTKMQTITKERAQESFLLVATLVNLTHTLLQALLVATRADLMLVFL